MNLDFIPYLIAAMIFYDVSIHFIYLIGRERFFIDRKINYWPLWSGHKYQIFWTIYWGTALILTLIYLITKI